MSYERNPDPLSGRKGIDAELAFLRAALAKLIADPDPAAVKAGLANLANYLGLLLTESSLRPIPRPRTTR